MIPNQAEAQQEALEALIAGGLLAPDTKTEITDDELERYVMQNVTLSAEDEAALAKAKPSAQIAIRGILRANEKEQHDCPAQPQKAKRVQSTRIASDEFIEAILIAQITREIATPRFPLGHLRQNKLIYFAHRKADEDVNAHFTKQAAGPYSPWATYKGPETIAQRNKYVKRARVGEFVGFTVGENIEKIDQYVGRYPVCAAADWVLRQFRYKKKDELELLATVDFAALDLVKQVLPITIENVKRVIDSHKKWKAKLQREIFSDANISIALEELRSLFPTTYT